MNRLNAVLAGGWMRLGARYLPFADAASAELPLGRLLRLSLFQVSVGMAMVLLTGTLNRVMIVELGVPAWLVALMVSLPLVLAPFRAMIGHRSDTHRSSLGWRRVPYIWMGSLLQFGGLAIMPFALLSLSGESQGPAWVGQAGAALAFLLVGAGLHTTQTAGLALACDLAPRDSRHRVVALLYVMLLVGMITSAAVFSALLADFSQLRLVQVIQGAAMLTMTLNIIALWKQEPRNRERSRRDRLPAPFSSAWNTLIRHRGCARFLLAVGFGTAAFSMQDVLLEPYGGEVLGLSVGSTTALTALMAAGALAAFTLAARVLGRGVDPCRLSASGALAGLAAFAIVLIAPVLESPWVFRCGVTFIGFGGGLFSVGTLIQAMHMQEEDRSGIALGAWGAVQATAAGIGIALGGAIRDVVAGLAAVEALGPALVGPATGYGVVYCVEILLLFMTLAVIGPLVGAMSGADRRSAAAFGLAELPG